MSNPSGSLFLGTLFVMIAAANVWLILQALARVNEAGASARLVAAHRIGGYLFILMFGLMSYFMISRMRDRSGVTSAGTMIHMAVAMLLTPLLFLKVLIARYYKSYYNLLMPIGLLIFVLSFVLVAMAAGPYFWRSTNIRNVSLGEINLTNATIDFTQAAATMQERCAKCHDLERVVSARKDARGWLATVNRMRQLPASGISEEDVKTIVLYLASQSAPEQSGPQGALAVARALVDQRCAACHSLDRVYKSAKTPDAWRETVNQMVDEAQTDGNPGIFHPGEDQKIIDFLSQTQTPAAVRQRQAQARLAAANGASLIKPETDTPIQPMSEPGRVNVPAAMVVFVSCLGTAVLVVRRPGKGPISRSEGVSAKTSPARTETLQATSASRPGTIILKLARIIRQTPDAKTLRFTLAENRPLGIKPGQFLMFAFLFDGKRVDRAYSICSSPAASGYVEITPKRMVKGCASIFLNERAELGMTVEASGPFGEFWLDETKHQRVVLLAAGSGITPMMAMLRYIDDYCLPTTVTLLYSARTKEDVMFHGDLEALRNRLTNFAFHILLTQPPAEWPGLTGRISRELVEKTIKEPGANYYFICGPGLFMEAASEILASLRVPPEKIIQETFGGSPPPSRSPVREFTGTGTSVEFVRSEKMHACGQEETLLQAAEQCGVRIPSGCRQGQCGACKVRLLAGSVSMTTEQGLPPALKEQGYVLTCVGHGNGPVKLDV